MKRVLVIIITASLLLAASPAQGAVYYVATTGSNSNNGSASAPFLTLDYALRKVSPGDTIQIAAGTYVDEAQTRSNGSADNLITIAGAGPSQTIITGRIHLFHSYYRLTGLRIQGNYLEILGSNASHNLLEGNEFTGGTQGIYMKLEDAEVADGTTGPAFNIIRSNLFYAPRGNGMAALTGHDNTVSFNTFRDGGGWDAMRVGGINQLISDNQFLRIISDPVATGDNHADVIQTFVGSRFNPCRNVIFERNYIKDCGSQLGNLENDATNSVISDWTFRNNVFINSRIQLNIYIPRVKIYNNTVYGVNNQTSNGFRFAYSTTKGNGNYGEVYNNIFITDQGSYSFNGNLTGTLADYNLFANLNGLAKSVPSEGFHNINGGVQVSNLFNSIDNGDFRLKPGSRAIDAGRDVSYLMQENALIPGITTDKDNNLRPQGLGFDIGAYEFADPLRPQPLLWVSAEDPVASEQVSDNGVFRVLRSGFASSESALTVSYSLNGSAINGIDYSALPGTVTIPAGSFYTDITLTPIDDNEKEGEEKAIISLIAPSGYNLSPYPSAEISIADNDFATPNLIAHWKLDAREGNTIFDSSGNGFTGTLENPLTSAFLLSKLSWVPGKIDNGLKFYGYVLKTDFSPIVLNALWQELIAIGYINSDGVIQPAFTQLAGPAQMNVSAEYDESKKQAIFSALSTYNPVSKGTLSTIPSVDPLWNGLIASNYMDADGALQETFRRLANSAAMTLSPAYISQREAIYSLVSTTPSDTEYAQVPHYATLEPQALTLTVWVNPAQINKTTFLGKNYGPWKDSFYGFTLDVNTIFAQMNCGYGPEYQYKISAPVIPRNEWTHLAMTYNGASLKLYLNGALINSLTAGKPRLAGRGALFIGRQQYAKEKFNGLIDDVRLYNRALSLSEIQGLYANQIDITGDVSGDGSITAYDAALALQNDPRATLDKADVNGDLALDALDAALIAQRAVEAIG